MYFQTIELRKEIEELKKSLHKDSVEQALREVKEYAARASEINVDTLQLKLMHLDEVARRANHDSRELYSITLQRFLCHKQNPQIGFLITSLLSTPAESKLFEKEQKFLKLHGKDGLQQSGRKESKDEKEKEKKNSSDNERQFGGNVSTQPFFNHMMSFPFRFGYPTLPRPPMIPRRGSGRQSQRFAGNGFSGCYKCGDLSHYQAFCDKK